MSTQQSTARAPSPRSTDEQQRLAALSECEALGTSSDASFDSIVRLAARVCETPMAMINYVEADTVSTKHVFDADVPGHVPRHESLCGVTILSEGVTSVADTALDERSRRAQTAEFYAGIRFYAAAPLELDTGERIGTLAVADLEEAWNSRFAADFGFAVDRPSNGCLQDVHWIVGLFGYYATNSLGNV